MNAPTRETELLGQIRRRVRQRLSESGAFRALSREQRSRIAHDTVQAFHYILGGEDGATRPRSVTLAGDSPIAEGLAGAPATGGTAGERFAGAGAIAAEQGTDAYARLVQQVDFPAFVAGLIDGVFNAIVQSSMRQMEAYAELVRNVAKSVDQYMKDHVTVNNARDYLAERYPEALELDLDGEKPRLRARRGVDQDAMPDFAGDLGMSEPVDATDDDAVEEQLVPAARRRIAMDRQQLLATMVMMGVNRLVVTNGKIEASCMFELNTSDLVRQREAEQRASQFAYKRKFSGYGLHIQQSSDRSRLDFLFGPTTNQSSASFNVTTTRTDDSEAKVETHAKLAGKVNVQFKSDYFPMERMVDALQIDQVRSKAPAGEKKGAPAGAVSPAPPARAPAGQAP